VAAETALGYAGAGLGFRYSIATIIGTLILIAVFFNTVIMNTKEYYSSTQKNTLIAEKG
jgi:hypothetical protein